MQAFCGSLLFGGAGCGLLSLLTIVVVAVHRQARVSGRAKRALTTRQTVLALGAVWAVSGAGAIGATLHAMLEWSGDYSNCQVLLYTPRSHSAVSGVNSDVLISSSTSNSRSRSNSVNLISDGVSPSSLHISSPVSSSSLSPSSLLSPPTTSSSSPMVLHHFTLFFLGPVVVVSFVVIIVAYVVIARAVRKQSRARVQGLAALYRNTPLPPVYRPVGGGGKGVVGVRESGKVTEVVSSKPGVEVGLYTKPTDPLVTSDPSATRSGKSLTTAGTSRFFLTVANHFTFTYSKV